MSSFTDPLEVRKIDGISEVWATTRAMGFYTDCDAGMAAPMEVRCRTLYTVEAGFRTDFATIPRVLWPWLGHPAAEFAQAAVLHDWLYVTMAAGSRARADAVFREAMRVLGVAAWKRWLMWAGVRLGGAGGWGRPAIKGAA
jgi:hypothetical protein